MAGGGTVSLLYFAWLRERVGTSAETLPLPAAVATMGELIAHLRARGAGFDAALSQPSVRYAVNQVFATPDTPVAAGDEVAFFPPVTGG